MSQAQEAKKDYSKMSKGNLIKELNQSNELNRLFSEKIESLKTKIANWKQKEDEIIADRNHMHNISVALINGGMATSNPDDIIEKAQEIKSLLDSDLKEFNEQREEQAAKEESR